MLKRIFYFLVIGFFGIAIWFINYQSDFNKYTRNLAQEAIEEERYTDVVRIFGDLFDKRSIIEEENEKMTFKMYPGTEQLQVVYYENEEEKRYVNYERSYYFYFFNIDFDLETYSNEEKQINNSSIRFISNNDEYNYYFINNDSINSESYIASPRSYIEAILNCTRDYVLAYENLNFINVNFSESIIASIEEQIGEIEKIAIIDARGNIVSEYDLSFDFQDQLFIDAGEMIDKKSYTLIKYEKMTDEEAKEKLADDFNNYYSNWEIDFKNNMNSNYEFRYDDDILFPTSLYFKSVWVLVIYLIIAILFYLILFKRRQLNNFARKIARKEPVKEEKPLKPYNPEDDLIDVDNPKIPNEGE